MKHRPKGHYASSSEAMLVRAKRPDPALLRVWRCRVHDRCWRLVNAVTKP